MIVRADAHLIPRAAGGRRAAAASCTRHRRRASPARARTKGGIAYRWVDEHGVVHYGDSVPPDTPSRSSTGAQQRRACEVRTARGAEDHPSRRPRTRSQAEAMSRQQPARQLPDLDLHLGEGYRAAARCAPGPAARPDHRRRAVHREPALAPDALQARARVFKPYSDKPDARRMPDDLAEEPGAHAERSAHSRAPPRRQGRRKQKTLREQFDADIKRYRELHAIQQPQ